MRRILYIGDHHYNSGLALTTGIARFGGMHGSWDLLVNTSELADQLQALGGGEFDGILVKSPREEMAAALTRIRTPVVQINPGHPAPTATCVELDHHAIGRMGAQFLLDKGFKRLDYYGIAGIRASAERMESCRDEVRKRGATFCGMQQPLSNDWRRVDRPATCRRYLRRLQPPVGLLCFNDGLANQLIRAAVEMGLKVPEDIAVLGVDDNQLFCMSCPVTISSIACDMEQLGYMAAAELQRLFNGGRPGGIIRLPPSRVVQRRSTDSIAVQDPELLAAMRFIHANAAGGINVNDVVKYLNLSRRTLERHFKQAFGRLPGDEIRIVRVRLAREMLLQTHLPLTQIAQRTGFADSSHFSKQFRQHFGVSPIRYRQTAGAMP